MLNSISVSELKALPRDYPGRITALSRGVNYLMGCGQFEQFCCTLRGLIRPHLYCPFCAKERKRRERKFLRVAGGWGLIENEFKRKDTKEMWLLVPLRHIVHTDDLTRDDWAAIGDLFTYCCGQNCLTGGGLVMRFGDPRYNAGTIEHLHINIITPIPGVEFRTPFAKTEKGHAENYLRLRGFIYDLNMRGGHSWLFSTDGIKETQPEF